MSHSWNFDEAFEEKAEAAATVMSLESPLPMVKLASHDQLVNQEMSPKNHVRKGKIAAADDVRADVMTIPPKSPATTMPRNRPKKHPMSHSWNFDEAFEEKAEAAATVMSLESPLPMVKLASHDQLVNQKMSPKNHVRKAKIAAADDVRADVMTIPPKSPATTTTPRNRPKKHLMSHLWNFDETFEEKAVAAATVM